MPLVRFEVRNEFGLGDPNLCRDASREDSKAVLDGVAVSGLVGILRQLGDLAEFAAEIFHDLHEQVSATSARGRNMFMRVQHVEAALPLIERTIQGQRSYIKFAYVEGSEWHADPKIEKSHMLSTDLPRYMMDSYEECRDKPHLYLLDKFDAGGIGTCLKRYSDPSYFKRVWAKSALEKSEKEKKGMKAQKVKRKRSRLKNGEVQSTVSASRCGSSARFASLSIDEPNLSTETASVDGFRFKPEIASRSTSFSSKSRLHHVEQVNDVDSPVLDDDLDYDVKLPSSKLKMNQKGRVASDAYEELNEIRANGNFMHDTLQDNSLHRSPLVRWDEKSEIVNPASPKPCDDSLEDHTQDADQDNYCFGRVPKPPCSVNHLNETAGDTDNFVDAFNTLESENETDSEWETRKKLLSQSNVNDGDMEYDSPKVQEMVTRTSKFSAAKTFPESKRKGTEHPFLDNSRINDFLDNNVLNMSISNESSDLEVTSGDQPPETNIYDPRIQQPGLRAVTKSKTQSEDSAPVDSSSRSINKLWTNGNILGLKPSMPPDYSLLHTESEESIASFRNSKYGHSDSMKTTNMHYSGKDMKSELAATSNGSSPLKSNSVDKIDGSSYIPSYFDYNDSSVYKLFQGTVSEVQQIDPSTVVNSPLGSRHDAIQDALCKDNGADLNSPVNSTVSSGTNEKGQNATPVSSSLSAFAQRILTNGFQRKASITDADISKPSEVVNAGMSSLHDAPLQSTQNEDPNGHNIKENVEPGSPKNSISSCSRYSGRSSPPLEHMKISFHPMNGSEISKLKLEFPSGIRHQSNEDLMFPSFQCLPGPALPKPVSGSESDDDTFCRSCPYTSEGYASPQSDSNSELWGQDDRSENQNFPTRSASPRSFQQTNENNQIGTAIGLENSDVDSGISYLRSSDAADLPGLDSFVTTNSMGHGECGSLSSDPVGFAQQFPDEQPPPPPLPPMQWRMIKTSFPKELFQSFGVSELGEQHEKNMPKQTCPPEPMADTNNETKYNLKGQVEQNLRVDNEGLDRRQEHLYHMQDKHNPQNTNAYKENISSHVDSSKLDVGEDILHQIENKHDYQKWNARQESKVSGPNTQEGEKEDLLVQIRNKSFNLRRTDTVKPTHVPQQNTNTNVTAILAKANAIRQAFVGSDDGSDEDNWSDS